MTAASAAAAIALPPAAMSPAAMPLAAISAAIGSPAVVPPGALSSAAASCAAVSPTAASPVTASPAAMTPALSTQAALDIKQHQPAPDAADAWYIYALIAPGTDAPPIAGVLADAGVEILPFRPVAILASRVPRALFEAASPTNRMKEPDWVAQRVAAHHAVISAAGPSLPLRFGVLFSDVRAMQAWLAPRAAALAPALDQAARQTEWLVTVSEDPDQLTRWLDQNDPGVRAILRTCAERGQGTAFLLARKLEKARQAARQQCLEQCRTLFEAWGQKIALTMLPEITRQGMPAWTIMLPNHSASLLTGEAALPSGLVDGLAWRLSGPWPNYALAAALTTETDNA